MNVFATTAIEEIVPGVSTYKPLFAELAAQDRFGTHHLVDDAEGADVVLFLDGHQHYLDLSMGAIRRHRLARAHPEKVFVYSQQDQPWCAMPGLYVAMPRQSFNWRRQRPCAYITVPNEYVLQGGTRTGSPDLLFSFAGRGGNRTRDRILHSPGHPRARIVDTSALDFFGVQTADIDLQKRRYAEIIARSKFVLCPRGAGPSSFRIFETMAAGRVPVVISDAWTAPMGPDWEKCALFISERQAHRISRLIEEQEPRFPLMAEAARREWEQWFSPQVLFHRMIEGLREIVANRTEPERLAPEGFDLRYWRLRARAMKTNIKQAAGQLGGALRARLQKGPAAMSVAGR
ncbi:MAG: exostosin family protein [Chthoniobacteraceae bacterium]|jgi:hypothetical protein